MKGCVGELMQGCIYRIGGKGVGDGGGGSQMKMQKKRGREEGEEKEGVHKERGKGR